MENARRDDNRIPAILILDDALDELRMLRDTDLSSGLYTASLPTLADGDRSSLRLDSSAALFVNSKLFNAAGTEMGTSTNPLRVQPGGAGFAVTVNSGLITLSPATSGGLSKFKLVSAASTNATSVKASAGQLYGFNIINTTASMKYVKLHNTAGTPTAGSGVTDVIGVPANGCAIGSYEQGVAFATGIGITTVTGAADADTTAVAANDLIINLYYR